MAYLLLNGCHVFPRTFLLLALLELVHTGFFVPGSGDEEPRIFGIYIFSIIIFSLYKFFIFGKYSSDVLFPVAIQVTLDFMVSKKLKVLRPNDLRAASKIYINMYYYMYQMSTCINIPDTNGQMATGSRHTYRGFNTANTCCYRIVA